MQPYYKYLLSLTPEQRAFLRWCIPEYICFPPNEPWVPCPDSNCRQFRLYFQTDKLGRPDCPICNAEGSIPLSKFTGRTPPPPCAGNRVVRIFPGDRYVSTF